jgi:aspartate kinase
MPLPGVVMKFGGTSVGTPEAIEALVRHVGREERAPLVVVSAVGGVTDLLLQAADLAATGQPCEQPLAEITERQRAIIEHFELDVALIAAQESELTQLLQGIAMLRELSPRVRDRLVSLGERMSARLLAACLRRRGQAARAHDAWALGMCTDEQFGRAEPLPGCYARIRAALEGLDGAAIPVTTGFIAHSDAGEITTLGRGGSDFSAAIFGVAAGVQEIQIWTDVPGILRADPAAVPGAAVVPCMRFEEAAELAFFGARVLHPRTIEPARQHAIPVRVLGTFHVDPEGNELVSQQGTLIDDQCPAEPIRGMALHREVQSLHIHSLRMLEAPGFLARCFEILARHAISVDVVATSEVSVSMTLDKYEGEIDEAVEELSEFAEVELMRDRSLLCLVGSGLREDASLLARVFQVLADNQVPIRVISQGASRINITVVTDPPYAVRAMRAIHDDEQLALGG